MKIIKSRPPYSAAADARLIELVEIQRNRLFVADGYYLLMGLNVNGNQSQMQV